MTDAIDWSNLNYDLIYEQRAENLKRLRGSPENLKAVKDYYKEHPVEFICDWGMTYDPRNIEIDLPATVPFILFDKQKEFVDWVIERWRNRESGLGEKSRDMGVSWLCVAVAHWMWFFYPGMAIGFGSRKEEYVDKLGDPKSLFWKLRKYIELMPDEFTPDSYEEKKHALYMRIINPENESVVVGEAGDNIGRGARTAIYFKDESAFYEHADSIDAALSQTSNCKIDISTPNGNANAFYRKRHSGKIPVFTFNWRDDPRKDEDWYQKQKNELDPVVLAQEVDIDYNASVSDAWISGELLDKAQNTGPADVEPLGGWVIAVDAAHFGDDESIVHARRGRLNIEQKAFRKVDGVALAKAVEDYCEDLTRFGDEIHQIVIELDGPGVSCYDQLRQGKYADVVNGVHTGARQSDDKNYNLRALIWRKARDYLKDGPVSMHKEAEIKAQLSSLKYKYKDGLLLMQDKKEYKKEFGRSPDRADAFVLTFAADDRQKRKRKKRSGGGWMG